MNSNTSLKTTDNRSADYTPLPLAFYERSTDRVARDLLGKLLVRTAGDINVAGRIVEVEAYFGLGDPASHACKGPTPRSSIMFGKPGRAYVYLNYGVHFLLNIVTDTDGKAGAVLLRALEPVIGIKQMLDNRPVKREIELSNGPGKLTKALGVTIDHNGLDMTDINSGLFVIDDTRGDTDSGRHTGGQSGDMRIAESERIGISNGKELQLRFYIDGNPYVSR